MAGKLPVLKIISTTDSRLSMLQVRNGQIIFVHDTRKIYMDMDNLRTCYEQITTLLKEQDRADLLVPKEGFYFVSETTTLWYYSDRWVKVSSPSNKYVVQLESYTIFPPVGNENCIYVDASENTTYRWDDANLKYYCTGRDYTEIQTINGGGAN